MARFYEDFSFVFLSFIFRAIQSKIIWRSEFYCLTFVDNRSAFFAAPKMDSINLFLGNHDDAIAK